MYRTLSILVFCLFALALAENYFPEPPSPPTRAPAGFTRSEVSATSPVSPPPRRNRFAGTIHRVANGTHLASTHTHVVAKSPLGDEQIHEINRDVEVSKRTINGWTTSVWSNPDITQAVSYYDAYWLVPPAPWTDSGSNIIFFFNSLESNPVNDILQPVLQYNNGVSGWTLASWYGVGNDYWEADPIAVNPGDKIRGLMFLQNGTWFIYGYRNGNLITTLSVVSSSVGDQYFLQWANENYNIDDCSELPATNNLALNNIYLGNSKGYIFLPAWYQEIYDYSCSPGATGGRDYAVLSWSY